MLYTSSQTKKDIKTMKRIFFMTILILTAVICSNYSSKIDFPRRGYTSVWPTAAPDRLTVSGSAAR
jgi:hypothetical protein